MSSKCLIHNVRCDVFTLCQVPQQHKHLVCHDAFLIVLRQTTNQLEQLLALFLACMHPAALYIPHHQAPG